MIAFLLSTCIRYNIFLTCCCNIEQALADGFMRHKQNFQTFQFINSHYFIGETEHEVELVVWLSVTGANKKNQAMPPNLEMDGARLDVVIFKT